jgi:leader peptidase (prepilin peptidase)/N-methyltransferase
VSSVAWPILVALQGAPVHPGRDQPMLFVAWPILVALGLGAFLIGTVVGSFLNVCIYRIPWQKSVIWPGSRCPGCWSAIAARDNIPIVSWFALRGECRSCGAPISVRYPLIEGLVGLLFLGAYLLDVIAGPRGPWGQIPAIHLVAAAYHAALLSLLVAATFIDYDIMEIPRAITVTGWVIGLGVGTLWPEIRPEPASRTTHWGGFWVGLWGLVVGVALIHAVRKASDLVLRLLRALRLTQLEEGMGLGDVDLLGMIGAFMGWQAVLLTFFLAPFFGLAQAAWKMLRNLKKKWLRRDQLSVADHEMPFGPYLSMAAATLVLVWPWFWRGWAKALFNGLYVIFWWRFGIYVNPSD